MILQEISAAQQIGFPILSALVFLPLVVSALLAPIASPRTVHTVAMVGALLELVLSLVVVYQFIPGADMQFVERAGMYHLGVDGISALFLPLTALLTLLVTLYAEPVRDGLRGYLIAIQVFSAAMMGAFVSVDLILFWIFFVAEIIPSWYLITRHGTGSDRESAAKTYVGYMVVASVALLAGFMILADNHASVTGASSYDLVALLKVPVPMSVQVSAFIALCLGLAIKAPIFPFHTWMPRVLEQGPVVGMSVFLVGVKLGTYGMMRFVIPLLPEASKEYFWILATLAVIGMVYGALIALVQTNLRRLLAFASLSHMGVVVIGLSSLNFTGMQGGLLQMINLGITGAGLFFIAAFLSARLGAPELSAMGGLQSQMPKMALAFLVIGLAGVGMPGTNGFNGEHLVMIGAYKVHWSLALSVGAGTILGAAYFLWYYQRAFMAEGKNTAVLADLNGRETTVVAALGVLIFGIGLYTSPFLQTMNGSVARLAQHIEAPAHLAVKQLPAIAPTR